MSATRATSPVGGWVGRDGPTPECAVSFAKWELGGRRMSGQPPEVRYVGDADNCPACGVSWVGAPIPEEHRERFYGGKTHFKRVLGEYDQWKDRTVAWLCPDCGARWPRDATLPASDENVRAD